MTNDNDPYHGFGDVVQGTAGIFGGDTAGLAANAHQEFHRVKVEATPQGLVTKSACQSCPRGQVIAIHWAEVIAIFYNVRPDIGLHGLPIKDYTPSNWSLDPQYGWVPVAKCACGDNAQPAISYQEITQALDKARKAGWVHPAGEQQLAQHLQRVQQHLQQGGMPR
jgi:hypothetical protein